MSTLPVVIALGIVSSIAAVVLMYIFIFPEKKLARLPALIQRIVKILNFGELFLEKFLRFIYILATVTSVVVGAFMLFGFSHYKGIYANSTNWYGGWGILLMILGPIALRLVFEVFMMFILLVKNTIEINQKLKNQNDENKSAN